MFDEFNDNLVYSSQIFDDVTTAWISATIQTQQPLL